MTSQTVPAILDGVLDPLNAIQEDVQAALQLARRNKLPAAFINTIKWSADTLAATWQGLNEIVTVLDPDRAMPDP